MTNPIGDLERNRAMGLLTDPNDPFSFRKDMADSDRPTKKKPTEADISKAIQAPHVQHPKNQLGEWGDLIRKHGNESRARQDALNARYDKIIVELEVADPDWWVNYPLSRDITSMVMRLSRESDERERNYLGIDITRYKREIVSHYIIPVMFACVRAGFVKYEEMKP